MFKPIRKCHSPHCRHYGLANGESCQIEYAVVYKYACIAADKFSLPQTVYRDDYSLSHTSALSPRLNSRDQYITALPSNYFEHA